MNEDLLQPRHLLVVLLIAFQPCGSTSNIGLQYLISKLAA
jgi:hypothetical protein